MRFSSSKSLMLPAPQTNLIPQTAWKRFFGTTVSTAGSGVDNSGTAITDANAYLAANPTLFKEVHTTAVGRLLLAGVQSEGVLEILPLFSDDSGAGATATGTIQVFGFDWVNSSLAGLVSSTTALPNRISGSDTTIGMGYNLARDDPGAPQTVPIAGTAAFTKIRWVGEQTGATDYATPLYDATGGTKYFVGQRLFFETTGFVAFVPFLTTLTGSTTCYLLARTY